MWLYFNLGMMSNSSKAKLRHCPKFSPTKGKKICGTCQRNKATEVDVHSGVVCSLCIFVRMYYLVSDHVNND